MSSRFPLRTFFEQELLASDGALQEIGSNTSLPTDQIVSHLVQRTVRRAALDAAAQRTAPPHASTETTDVSWKHCLMVAALTELRPVKLLARG